MTFLTPASRHRDERGVVAPSRLMLVAIVIVAIGAAMFFATAPGGKDDAPAAASASTSASATPSKAAPSVPADPATSASAEPSSKASSKPSSTPSAEAPPSKTPAPEPVAVDRAQTTVAVFNNSGRKGLAKRTATKVTGAGWKVSGTDNWYGTVPSTTVYFPKKMQAAAKALAADLGIRRIKAAQSPMRDDRLTLILTSDYAS